MLLSVPHTFSLSFALGAWVAVSLYSRRLTPTPTQDLGQVINGCLSCVTRTMHTDYVWHTPVPVATMRLVEPVGSKIFWIRIYPTGSVCTESLSYWTEELCVRLAFCPELQLVIVVGKKIYRALKLSSGSTLHHKVAERRGIHKTYETWRQKSMFFLPQTAFVKVVNILSHASIM
jgi:hypothetical protein